MILRAGFLVACLFLAAVRPAAAQIYSWRDANGGLVVSNQRPAPGTKMKVYHVERVEGIRVTRPAVARLKGDYDVLIDRNAALYSVSPELVRAVMQVESGFNPNAVSSKGAMGLMQLMPATAIELGVTNPFDPEQNIRGGVAYLRQLLNRYGNDVTLALAAYNAGPAVADKYKYRIPFSETRNYVARVRNRLDGTATAGAAQGKARSQTPPAPQRVYKVVEIINGRPVIKYTDTKPTTGAYELVSRRDSQK